MPQLKIPHGNVHWYSHYGRQYGVSLKKLGVKLPWKVKSESEVAQSYPTLCDPMDCTHQAHRSIECFRKEYWSGLPFPSPKLPYDPTIPLLGIYPEKTVTEKDTCTPVFTAALFTITRTWKEPRCLLTDEWIKQLWYMYTIEYHSAIKGTIFGHL